MAFQYTLFKEPAEYSFDNSCAFSDGLNVVSLFSGCGGLDLGFSRAGFKIIWANEYDKTIWETYRKNHKFTKLDTRNIIDIPSSDVPDCDGIIGGPPCQSWSEAGAKRGINDKRGQLFFEFIRLLQDKKPKFFLAENVSGMLAHRHNDALQSIKDMFMKAGYRLYWALLNAVDYGVPQDRKRVFFIGFREDIAINHFNFPMPMNEKKTLHHCLSAINPDLAVPAAEKNYHNTHSIIANHEYMTGGFSTIFMSRNRVRNYDEQSFTIQAGGRHAPIHPQAPKMEYVEKDRFRFSEGSKYLYRRLTIRECAAIQTFPNDFIFYYTRIADGYKMVGNAVPIELAHILALSIKKNLRDIYESSAGTLSFIENKKLQHSSERNAI